MSGGSLAERFQMLLQRIRSEARDYDIVHIRLFQHHVCIIQDPGIHLPKIGSHMSFFIDLGISGPENCPFPHDSGSPKQGIFSLSNAWSFSCRPMLDKLS